jgi:hypothetical protein
MFGTKIRYRKRIRLSITRRLGPFSRNSRRPGVTRIDLPGGFHGEIKS